MGRKLDLSSLTDEEAEHVLQVVQRDMRLRKEEQRRLSELRQELDEEGSRSALLSRRRCFNQRCCIRCCASFSLLLNPKRCCRDCCYNVCRGCRAYSKPDRAYLCFTCQRRRLLKTQSLEWFYTNVKSRFKRFGSAKVLKNLYKKHSAEHSTLSELTEGSTYEESLCNDGSVYGSDSAFYRQSEEHSTAETLTVAMQVAEEAIDEAISKAEFDKDNQEKQNEAHYLREHRGKLIDELAKTIVQNIISRRKSLAEMKQESEQNYSSDHNTDLQHYRAACTAAYTSLNLQPGLWKSCSALSSLDVNPPALKCEVTQTFTQGLKKEDANNALPAWKSVDRLDNSGPSVLKSPDGNWIALQSAQLPRPSLLAKRKSLVYSALERESCVVSAYEGMGSDAEAKPEADDAWASALREIQRRMAGGDLSRHSRSSSPGPPAGSDAVLPSDSDSDVGACRHRRRSLLTVYRMKAPQGARCSSSRRTSITDVNFDPEGLGEETSAAGTVRRTRKTRRSKKEKRSSSLRLEKQANKQNGQGDGGSQYSAGVPADTLSSGGDSAEEEELEETGVEGDEEGAVDRVTRRLVAPSSLAHCSSDDEVDPGRQVGPSRRDRRGDGGQEDDGKTEAKLYRLASQFSSTEDELDEAGGWGGRGRKQGRGALRGREARETAQASLLRRASMLSACQLSSTEDELYRVDEGEGETAHELEGEGLDRRGGADPGDASDSDVITFHFVENGILEMTSRAHGGGVGTGGPGGRAAQDADGVGGQVVGRRSWQPRDKEQPLSHVLPDSGNDGDGGDDGVDGGDGDGGHGDVDDGDGGDGDGGDGGDGDDGDDGVDGGDGDGGHGDVDDGDGGDGDGGHGDVDDGDDGVDADGGEDGDGGDVERHRIVSSMSPLAPYERQEDKVIETLPETAVPDEVVKVRRTEGCEEMKGGVEKADRHRKVLEGKGPSGPVEGEVARRGMEVKVAREQESDYTTYIRREQEKINLENTLDVAANELKCQKWQEGEEIKLKEAEDQQRSAESSAQAGQGVVERGGDKLGESVEEECDKIETEDREQMTSSQHKYKGMLSPEEICNRYSAQSLCNITTEVLKVLNATEELLQGEETGDRGNQHTTANLLPPNADERKLDQQFSRLEENVYIAAGTAYSLEEELGNLEECARSVSIVTSDLELSFLEEQVASAAAQVQQSELQVSDISARIAALKCAGLNVDPKAQFSKAMPNTLNTSRQIRRRLPAPPKKDKT